MSNSEILFHVIPIWAAAMFICAVIVMIWHDLKVSWKEKAKKKLQEEAISEKEVYSCCAADPEDNEVLIVETHLSSGVFLSIKYENYHAGMICLNRKDVDRLYLQLGKYLKKE